MKKIAIIQSNYIPWKGYFDLIAAVDEFILYDDMQFTRRDWRNRNMIKTPQGVQWLSVPVKVKGKFYQSICETEIDDVNWAESHWKALIHNYCRALYFEEIASIFEPFYKQYKYTHLSVLNRELIEVVCSYLGIKTKINDSSCYKLVEGKSVRLADLCLQAGGTEYISGPAAKDYIEEHAFVERGIKLSWFDYDNYPEYPQLWGKFTHNVSILDLLFNCGKKSLDYMKQVVKK
jgi:hypothetical protein